MEPRGWTFIKRIYMRHMRQQLSRMARQTDWALQWDPEDPLGFESAFSVFSNDDLADAARALFFAICPGEARHVYKWQPPLAARCLEMQVSTWGSVGSTSHR